MSRLIVRRLLQAIPLMVGITVIVSLMIYFAPGDAAEFAISARASEQEVQRVRRELGLDLPWHQQYALLAGKWLRGDFGQSFIAKRPVTEMIAERLPRTAVLLGLSIVLSLAVAIPIGIYSALRRYTLPDGVITVLSFIGISVPSFWLGIMLILVFSIGLGWLPTGGVGTVGAEPSLLDSARYLIMPLLVLTLVRTAAWVRYLRSSMLEVLAQEYMTVARAKGLPNRLVISRHGLRNALLPIVTLLGLSLPDLIAGAIITEQIFNWKGLGQLIVDSSLKRDTPVVMALVILTGIAIVIGNLLADVAYGALDPRIRV